jgi:hypothetical protein
MTSKIKCTLIAGAITLAAALSLAQSAQAGGRHYLPLGPFNSYAADAYDDDYDYYNGCGDCGHGYDAEGSAAATAKKAARRYLGVDLEDVIDEIAD